MKEEHEEGYVFFRAGCITVAFVIACFSGCVMQQNYVDNKTEAEMVAHGADPLAAKCAIRDSQLLCGIVAAARKEAPK